MKVTRLPSNLPEYLVEAMRLEKAAIVQERDGRRFAAKQSRKKADKLRKDNGWALLAI